MDAGGSIQLETAKEMDKRQATTTALLTEHLRYTPLTLLDDIINTVNELVFQAVNNIEGALLGVPPDQLGFALPKQKTPTSKAAKAAAAQSTRKQAGEAKAGEDEQEMDVDVDEEDEDEALYNLARTEIESGIVKLESLLNATVDKDFDKLEIYTLRNLLTVSNVDEEKGLEDWVLLRHYENLNLPSQSSATQQTPADTPTPESLDVLRRKVVETEKLNALLKAESERNTALLSSLQPLLQGQQHQESGTDTRIGASSNPSHQQNQAQPSLAFLTNSKPSPPLAQSTRFTLAQLYALRDVVKNKLQPYISSLPSAVLEIDTPAAKVEVERRRYIDNQSRKAMERAGVEGGGQKGAAQAGNLGLGGRRAGDDEIRALEGMFGTAATGGAGRKGEGERDEYKMEE